VKESGFSLEELAMIQPTYRNRGGYTGRVRKQLVSKREKSEEKDKDNEDESEGNQVSGPSTQTSEPTYSKNEG